MRLQHFTSEFSEKKASVFLPVVIKTNSSDFIAAPIVTYFDESRDDDETREELERLFVEAENAGVTVTAQEFVEAIQQREAELSGAPVPEYSWPHLEDFRHFDLAGRCFVWHVERELREKVRTLPGSNHPSWGPRFNS